MAGCFTLMWFFTVSSDRDPVSVRVVRRMVSKVPNRLYEREIVFHVSVAGRHAGSGEGKESAHPGRCSCGDLDGRNAVPQGALLPSN
jgi:hypothetical protein